MLMRIEPGKIKNILAVRNDRFGEFLLNIPAFRALKETFTGAKLTIVTSPDVESLAKSIPFIDEVIVRRQKGNSLLSKLGLISLLRRNNFDIAIMLNPSKEFNIATYLSGIPIRVGYDRKCGFLLTRKMEDKKYLGEKHEIEYNLELVNLTGAATQDKGLYLEIDPDLSDSLISASNLKNADFLIAIHPWTSDPVKQWPKEKFRELALRLASESGVKVIIIGGRDEAERDGVFFAGLGENIINLAGKTTLPQLGALLKKCRLLVSCDSGPVHLACSVGTPVIALFRSDIPGKSAKRWGPWGKGHAVIEKNIPLDISVEEVFIKIRQKIGEISHN